MYKILLLEDDEMLLQTLNSLLKDEGYSITLARDANEVIDITFESSFDLYLFDINVPFGSGVDLLKELRDSGDTTPAFFITALKDIKTLSKAFQSGCDDYIKKPFDFDELIIRIEAILKKQHPFIVYKELQYDPKEQKIYKNGSEIEFGEVSKKVLVLLLENIDRVVKKEEFFDIMKNPTDTALRVMINKLKNEFDLNIINVRGVGYKLEKL